MSVVQADSLLTMLSPLIVDQKDQPEDEMDAEDFSEEQHTVARFINLLEAAEPDQQYVVSGTDDECPIVVPQYISFMI